MSRSTGPRASPMRAGTRRLPAARMPAASHHSSPPAAWQSSSHGHHGWPRAQSDGDRCETLTCPGLDSVCQQRVSGGGTITSIRYLAAMSSMHLLPWKTTVCCVPSKVTQRATELLGQIDAGLIRRGRVVRRGDHQDRRQALDRDLVRLAGRWDRPERTGAHRCVAGELAVAHERRHLRARRSSSTTLARSVIAGWSTQLTATRASVELL